MVHRVFEIAALSKRETRPYDIFITCVSIFAIVLVTWQFFLLPDSDLAKLFHLFDYIFCGIFLFDYFHEIVISKNRTRYIFTWGLFDLASSIPVIGPVRYLRLGRIIRVLYVVRSFRILAMVLRRDAVMTTVSAVLLMSIVIILACCIGILHSEKNVPDGNIKTVSDVAWWAVVTTSTIGYGDLYPVTQDGRILAVIVMVVGIGAFATLVGAVAGVMLRNSNAMFRVGINSREDETLSSSMESINKIAAQCQAIADRLDRLDARLDEEQRP